MNHHRESHRDFATSILMIIKEINNLNSLHFPGTTSHGDHGYNDDIFYLIEDADMGFPNTTKHGPYLVVKFGMTQYNTLQDQKGIPENRPAISLGAVRTVG